jgi:hypothetical protein
MSDPVEGPAPTESAENDGPIRFMPFAGHDRIELVATIVLSIAAILTAWSVFQGGKWGGVESFQLAEAGAARTESIRSDNAANEQALADITMFDNWLLAVQEDIDSGLIQRGNPLDGDPEAFSAFFYRHMREEFKPAINAWLGTDPFQTFGIEESMPLPYELDAYQLASRQEAIRLSVVAAGLTEDARQSNGTSDAYVFTAVLFATVLFFAGVSVKMADRRNRLIMLGFGILILVGAAVALVVLPVDF